MDNFTRLKGLCIIAFSLVTSSLSAQLVDGVAAVVNDQVITFSDVKKVVDPNEKVLRENYVGQELVDKVKEARLSVLKALIEKQLIIQDFKKAGYFIPDNVIEDRLKNVIKDRFDGDRTVFVKTLLADGMSIEQFKQTIRDDVIIQAMRQKNVSSAVIVSPFKVEQYYQGNLKQFVQPDQVKLRLIYIKKSLFPEKRTNANGQEEEFDPGEEAAKEILYKIQTGSKFSELARMYSEGPKRDLGGDLGWMTKDALRAELVKEAFKLKPTQTSSLIRTVDGYYIIHVDDIKKATVQPIGDVRDQIEKTLVQDEKQRLQQDWLDGLRTKAFIKMF
jgi:peptidyl-prolyl cis-trans isomerase SurA